MSADAVRARLAELREAGAKLRSRPAAARIERLAQLLDGWRDPDSSWRRELASALPAATGLHQATVREGLARGLGVWSGADLRELVRRELGSPRALDAGSVSGFGATAVILAGQIPMPSLLSILAPLVLGSPVLVKSASRDRATPALVARSIAELDGELGRCVAVVDLEGDDAQALGALLEADCVVANGSDETLAAVAARVAPPRRWVGYGHRVSLSAVGEGATRGRALEEAARGAALDVALWDQLGCLSPIAIAVVDPDPRAADRVSEALAAALAELEARLPRGAIGAGAAALTARERADAELRAAAGRRVALHAGPGWTVVREEDARPRPAPLHRFVRVLPVPDLHALAQALGPLGPWLAAVGVAGFADAGLAQQLAALGASRVCPLGQLQSPPLDWPRDGRGVLLPLARLSRDELG